MHRLITHITNTLWRKDTKSTHAQFAYIAASVFPGPVLVLHTSHSVCFQQARTSIKVVFWPQSRSDLQERKKNPKQTNKQTQSCEERRRRWRRHAESRGSFKQADCLWTHTHSLSVSVSLPNWGALNECTTLLFTVCRFHVASACLSVFLSVGLSAAEVHSKNFGTDTFDLQGWWGVWLYLCVYV